jgi:hypothetical protein
MLEVIEIKPKLGLSSLHFGASMQEAEKYLGKAEEVEVLEEEDGFNTSVWHYWQKGYSLFFNAEHNNVFSCVEIDNQDSKLWGVKVFELDEKGLKELFKENGHTNIETEDQEWGETRVSFDDLLVDCYFENGKLISINYGIYIDNNRVLILPN